jgi:hypothetical protein
MKPKKKRNKKYFVLHDGVIRFKSQGPGARKFLFPSEKECKVRLRGDLSRSRFISSKKNAL